MCFALFALFIVLYTMLLLTIKYFNKKKDKFY